MAKEKGFMVGKDKGIGRGDFAGMPRELVMKEYPKPAALRDGMLDDSMVDIDRVQHQGEGKAMKYVSNQK